MALACGDRAHRSRPDLVCLAFDRYFAPARKYVEQVRMWFDVCGRGPAWPDFGKFNAVGAARVIQVSYALISRAGDKQARQRRPCDVVHMPARLAPSESGCMFHAMSLGVIGTPLRRSLSSAHTRSNQ